MKYFLNIQMFFLHTNVSFYILASLDGSLGYILSVTIFSMEKTYRRLLMLQNVLVTHICHIAGLNPKAYRQVSITIKQILHLLVTSLANCISNREYD